MNNAKQLQKTVSVLFILAMAGMVVTAPVWLPVAGLLALKDKLTK